MTTYLGKSCSFCLPRVPFVNCRPFMYLVISLFGFEGRIWDLIVSVPDHCLSFYFVLFNTEINSSLTAYSKDRDQTPRSGSALFAEVMFMGR